MSLRNIKPHKTSLNIPAYDTPDRDSCPAKIDDLKITKKRLQTSYRLGKSAEYIRSHSVLTDFDDHPENFSFVHLTKAKSTTDENSDQKKIKSEKNIIVFEPHNSQGKLYYESGKLRYTGEVIGFQPSGTGILFYESGAMAYEGEWMLGQREGQGTVFHKDTRKYAYHGAWYKNEKLGQGTEYDKNGNKIYQGDFRNNLRDGEGTSYFADSGNVSFDGRWRNGKPHGYGKLYYQDGVLCYDGNWILSEWHGYGKQYDQNGKLFKDGNWKNGKLDGLTPTLNCQIF